jgi:hypothetical protein
MKHFNGDRLSASGQIDQTHPSSTDCRVRFLPFGQDPLANSAPVLVLAECLKCDFFPKGEIRGSLLGLRAVSLAFLWAINAAQADTFGAVAVQDFEVLLCRNGFSVAY